MAGKDEEEEDTKGFLVTNGFFAEECEDPERQSAEIKYKNRKPRWWIQLSRKASKAQRRAINDMKEFILANPPYGNLIDLNSAFQWKTPEIPSVWLEIGFGAGDNLLRLAEQYTDKAFIGAEIHKPGIGKIMQKIKYGTENKCYWNGSLLYSTDIDPDFKQSESDNNICAATNAENEAIMVENPYSNLRIYQGDGVRLLSNIPSGTLEAVLVTNPDPFPREGQEEWRLFQVHTLREIRRVLVPTGQLYLATDHEGFFSWSHEIMSVANDREAIFEIVHPTPSRKLWLPVVSEYEQRGWDSGRRTLLSCWEAVSSSREST